MKLFQSMTTVKKYLPLYLLTIIIAFVMRYISKVSDSDALCWILTPTTWWVSVLSGIRFEYLPHMGYVNYYYNFLIAPTCSGSRFILIIFLMLIFSFLYRIKSAWSGYMWFGFSVIFSYVFTIFVNGIRITASIYVPIALEKLDLIGGLLTQDRLHTIIGTATYFSFMCAAYPLADYICRRVFMYSEIQSYNEAGSLQQNNIPMFSPKLIIPAFWYIFTVLVIPFIGRVYRNDWEGFGQYTALIIGVCLVIAATRQLTSLFLYVIYYFRQLPK
ncbi:MAG: exosortase K [Lachnospiraceae bacterium]|nr:exosortase K [Lachnospiraceae bacterium]